MAQEATKAAPPTFDISVPEALAEWAVPMKTWLQTKDKHFDGLMTSALVFDTRGRVLLVKRAAHDSMPNRWEPPGGAVDPEDQSILHGCARELWEEAGLTARRIVRVVPESGQGFAFVNRTGTRVFYRFSFEVEVESSGDIKLDPEEHTQWRWASDEEVRLEKLEDGTEMPITTDQTKKHVLWGLELKLASKANQDQGKGGEQ